MAAWDPAASWRRSRPGDYLWPLAGQGVNLGLCLDPWLVKAPSHVMEADQQRPAGYSKVANGMSETVLVSPNLVRYVRKGVRSQLGFAAQRLATCLLELEDDPIDEYKRSLHVFQVAHTLYDQIKAAGDQPPSSIAIDIAPNALLVLRALECQYNTELDRLREAEFYGIYKDAVRKDVRALGDLVREIKSHIEQKRLDRTEPFPKPPVL